MAGLVYCLPHTFAGAPELLGSSLDVCDPDGTLDISTRELEVNSGMATLIATYKNGKGVFEPSAIKIDDKAGKVSDNSMVFELETKEKHTYIVTAGKKKVEVEVKDTKNSTQPETTNS